MCSYVIPSGKVSVLISSPMVLGQELRICHCILTGVTLQFTLCYYDISSNISIHYRVTCYMNMKPTSVTKSVTKLISSMTTPLLQPLSYNPSLSTLFTITIHGYV